MDGSIKQGVTPISLESNEIVSTIPTESTNDEGASQNPISNSLVNEDALDERQQQENDIRNRPNKKQRTSSETTEYMHAKTPDITSDYAQSTDTSNASNQLKPTTPLSSLPSRNVHTSDSALSDVSSTSASSNRRYSLSPQSEPYAAYLGPPLAPPSTPSSIGCSLYNAIDAGLATPIPTLTSGRFINTFRLERQKYQQEPPYDCDGAETPAPTQQAPPSQPPESASAYAAAATPGAATPGAATPHSNDGRKKSASNRFHAEDFSDWAVGDRYKLIRMLGRGSYGEVAQALDLDARKNDAYVAIKRIQSPFDKEVDSVRLYREINILRRIRGHPCIIQLLDVVQPPTDDLDDFHDLYLVFEYIDTDLYKLIMSPQYFTTEHIQTFLYQMLAGLNYLHSCSIIHRDLKPANILINENCSLKICDFGLARIVGLDSTTSEKMESHKEQEVNDDKLPNFPIPKMELTRQMTKHVATRWYRAPELILIQPYTAAVDMWSLGCILAELLSMQVGNCPGYEDRKPIFPGGTCYPLSGDGEFKYGDRFEQLNVIFSVIGTPCDEDLVAIGEANSYVATLKKTTGKTLESIYPDADPAALDLLKRMLQFNPTKRITAKVALEHPFFQGVRNEEMEVEGKVHLKAPVFLESNRIKLKLLKQKTYEEVRLFNHQNGECEQDAE